MLKIFGHFMPGQTLVSAFVEMLLLGMGAYFLLNPGVLITGTVTPIAGSAPISLLLSAIAILVMMATGLYNHDDSFQNYRTTAIKSVMTFVLMVPIVLIIGVSLRYFPSGEIGFGAAWYLKATLAWLVCAIFLRIAFFGLASIVDLKRRVVVIGRGVYAEKIRQIEEQSIAGHFVPVAFVRSSHEGDQVLDDSFTLSEGNGAELVMFVRGHRASEIVVATDDRRGLPTNQLLRCKMAGIKVTDYLSFCERESGRVDLDALQPSWLIFSDGFRTGLIVKSIKRTFDIVASLAVLILTLPVLGATAVLIVMGSSGPILYRQERIGQFGKTFTLLKFRSMRVDAESAGNPQWAAMHDARVTRVGTWIRKVRIDELPQLVNVLKGEMSFIGPRPERPFFVDQLAKQIRFYGERHSVKPGISGWAQINYPYGASLEDSRKKLEFDLYYVKNRTLFLDLVIFIQTVRVILFPEGAR